LQPTIERLDARRLCAAGDQDLSYGDNGFVRLQFGDAEYQFLPGSDPTGTATVVSMSVDGESFSLRKFNAGVPDATAGPGGTIAINPLPFDPGEGARAVPFRAWDFSSGRTVIEFITHPSAASRFGDSFFVRLNPDRTLDTTYGTDGVRAYPGRFWHEVVQQGDKLVAIQDTDRNVLLRYDEDGALDLTFGSAGRDELPTDTVGLFLQPDGKILTGTRRISRRNPDGGADTTFGEGDGFTDTTGGRVGLDSAGRIIVSGSRAMNRLTPAGLYDTTFGDGGVLTFEVDPALTNFRGETFVPGADVVTISQGRDFVRVDAAGQRDAAFGRVVVDLRRALVDLPPLTLLSEPQVAVGQPDGSILIHQRVMDGRFLQVRIAGGGSGSASVALDGDVVTLDGTDLADRIETDDAGAIINAYVNGVGRSFARPPAASYRIDARGGNDVAVVEFFGSEVPARIFGSDGDDRLVGGRGNDTIFGGNGYDRIDGEDGDDRLSGGDGRDWIRGQDEKDTILGEGWGDFLDGGGGNDVIEGGGFADQLTGGRGEDTLHGDLGNDIFHSADGTVDQLLGEAGTDDATDADENDLLTSIETI